MNKIIKVDLSQFFDDERKMCCIFVDPTWKTVECLQKRVEHLFDLSSICFLSDGSFLPSKEPIEIIKYCDIIRAFVPKEFQEMRKKKKSKKHKEQTKSEGTLPEGNDNIKDVNNDIVTSTHDTITTSQTSFTANQLIEDCNTESSLSGSKIAKNPSKKRKSTVNEEVEVMASTRLSKIASSTLLNESGSGQDLSQIKNPFKKQKSLQAHIYFNESGDILSPKSKTVSKKSLAKKDKEQGTIVVFRCPLNDVTNSDAQPQKPRVFHLRSKNKTNKPVIEIQEDILIPTFSTLNSSDESLSTNEATITNIVENSNIAENACKEDKTFNNSTIAQPDKADNESQNEETSINKSNENESIVCKDFTETFESENKTNINKSNENESIVCKDVTETLESENKNDIGEIGERVCESRNESRKDLSTDYNNISEIENNSEIDCSKADNNTTESQMEEEETTETNDKSKIEEQSTEAMDESKIEQSNINETSIMSVDCVDLSIDLEAEEIKSNDNIREKHDLTADDNSSASDVEEVSEIIDLNESELNSSSISNNSIEQNISFKKIKINKILPFSTDLISLPSLEDIIVFKMPYSNNSKILTNYIAGKVEYVNKRTKMIKILILDGFPELRHVPNNFICNLDDSQATVNQLQLKLSDMIEPKLFSIP